MISKDRTYILKWVFFVLAVLNQTRTGNTLNVQQNIVLSAFLVDIPSFFLQSINDGFFTQNCIQSHENGLI
jgi:hypothetical protein